MSDTPTLARRGLLVALATVPGLALAPGLALSRPTGTLAAPAVGRRAPPNLPLVMLDPGHGGRDPGAVGVTGTYEKHVAFAAAQELQRQLTAGGRCRVKLTRSRDVFIPLPERVGIAQRHGAALFMSLHADAVSDPGVRGASVYTLSDAPSDAQTAALARRENAADQRGPAFQGMPPDVAQILSSLAFKAARQGSATMAHRVVSSMQSRVATLNNPARHATFAVLKAPDIPSVLVEMGFMSNRGDEDALKRPEYRARVAGSLKGAVEDFLASGNRAVRFG